MGQQDGTGEGKGMRGHTSVGRSSPAKRTTNNWRAAALARPIVAATARKGRHPRPRETRDKAWRMPATRGAVAERGPAGRPKSDQLVGCDPRVGGVGDPDGTMTRGPVSARSTPLPTHPIPLLAAAALRLGSISTLPPPPRADSRQSPACRRRPRSSPSRRSPSTTPRTTAGSSSPARYLPTLPRLPSLISLLLLLVLLPDPAFNSDFPRDLKILPF